MLIVENNISVAFCGNSILYYNDCPRVLEALSGGRLTQDSCLRGGASLKSLMVKGNGMGRELWPKDDCGQPSVKDLFASRNWDFVVTSAKME